MSTYQLGFIGTGNMGGALAQAAAKSGADMLLSNRTAAKAEALAAKLGCAAGTNLEIAESCSYIFLGCTAETPQRILSDSRFVFLGVKPQMLPALLEELKAPLLARKDRFVLVSMAAGITIETIQKILGLPCPVVRIMPNLPVALGKGVVLISPDDTVTEEEISALEKALPAGLLMQMPEDKIDAGSAVSGCGPAFVYLFLDALANGGVSCGLPYPQALALAAQTMIGAAEMTLSSGKHPGKLQSEVCSPGGTTIAGVRALEQHSVRAAAMDAVIAAYERTCELAAH